MSKGLRNYLLETCTLMGERFPEYDEWLATEKAEKEEHWKRVRELEGDPAGLLLFALEKLTGKKAADVSKARPPVPPAHRGNQGGDPGGGGRSRGRRIESRHRDGRLIPGRLAPDS